MQLTFPKAPANGVQTLRPALQAALHTQGLANNRQLANIAPSKISLSAAYRGYSLTLDDLSQGHGLSAARLGDWHYLVFADGVSIADAQLANVRGHVEFTSLNHGTMAAATVDALKLAEQSAQLHGKTVEMRVLFISALHVVAIWLHAADEDVLIPIAPTPQALAPTQLYSEAALLGRLQAAAASARHRFDADTTGLLGS
jgi:hypothetical protein